MQHGHACKYDTLLLHAHIDLVLVHDCKLAMDERVLYRCNLRSYGYNCLISFVVGPDICHPFIAEYDLDRPQLHNDEHSVHLILWKLLEVI